MDAPDMSSLMQEKPSPVETMQHQLGAAAQGKFMRETIGTEKKPGTARLLSQRIDEMTSPRRIQFERGRAMGGLQQKFNGVDSIRTAAVKGLSGSGLADVANQQQHSQLGSAMASANTNVGLKAKAMQTKARTGFAKIGEGMADSVQAHLNNLGELETQAAANRVRIGEMDAERALKQSQGFMSLGEQGIGMVTAAAVSAGHDKDVAGSGDFGKWGSRTLENMGTSMFGTSKDREAKGLRGMNFNVWN